MKPPRTALWGCLFIVVAGLFLHPGIASAQQPPPIPASDFTPDVRSRLTEAARDPMLAPWQRGFMLRLSQGESEPIPAGSSVPLARPTLPAAAAAAEDGSWTDLFPPPERYFHTAIYDPVRDRMVVFGGSDGGLLNDVWALSLAGSPAWTLLTPTGSAPSTRIAHTAIYDPVRDRIVVFGGYDGGHRNDVWALSLAGSPAWTPLAPAGSPPSGRSLHTAIYDPVRDRMVVFGGSDDTARFNDVWALSLAGSPAWTLIAPAGSPPSARYAHTAIYDSVRDRMVVFAGDDGGYLNDVWTLSLAGAPTWTLLAPTGTLPPARWSHTAIYDSVRDRMVVFGGYGGYPHNDVWALSLAGSPAWTPLAPAGSPPSGRSLHTAIYDPVRDHMVVFGGQDNSARFNDVWALSLAGNPAWTLLIRPASPPSGRAAHAAIYDPVRDRMVVFGGDDAADLLNDVWALSLAGSPVWTQLAPTGSPPPARDLTTAIYDPVRDRMVVFGGQAYGFPGGAYILNDVWALSLTGVPAWTQLAPAGSPPPVRALPAAIYDPVRDRMVVFGGDGESSPVNDVWALSLAGSPSWTMLTPSGAPPPARFGHTAVYDPVRDRMLVFAGYPSHYYGGAIALDDVWALSLAGSPAWIAIVPGGSPPTARHSHTAIYDPVRDRMIVFGGEDDTSPFVNDAWALSLAGNPAWLSLALAGSPPCPRAAHTAIYDPVRDRMLVFGGDDVTGAFLNDAWSLAWGTSVSVPGDADAVAHRFELAPPRPNPSRGETVVAFELPAPARVVIDVFDTQGRWVKRLADESFTAGRHASTWRGDDEGGHPLGSGVYFIRMCAGAFQAARRTVRVR